MAYTTTIQTCMTLEHDGATFVRACLELRSNGVLVGHREVEVNTTTYPTEAEVRAQLAAVRDAWVAEASSASNVATALAGTVLQ